MIPVFDAWRSVPPEWKGGVVALGNFDGVHRGHQALLARAREQAASLGAPVVAFTFEPHPRGFFVPDTGPFRLTLLPAKTRLLAGHGVQAVLAQRFDESFAALPAASFIEDVLRKGLGARHVVCGYDFTFGARRSGNVEMLRAEGKAHGFGVTVLDPVTHEGEIYSSTRIREALRHGWARDAAGLLGHDWEIEGTVELGDQRGRTIGFPTANVASASTRCVRWSTGCGGMGWRTSASARPSASCRRISRSTCSTSRATSTARSCGSLWSISSGPR